jgi:type II secretory pathway pseudopilin PulG
MPPGLPLHNPTPPRGQRGSSLIELMVGLGILMVLSGLAVPAVSALVRAYNLRTAVDDVVYAVGLARNQAAANRKAYGLVFDNLTAPGAGLRLRVVQGLGTGCTSTNPAGGAVQVYATDYTVGNALNRPPIAITAFAPSELANPAVWLCFKPDGRVLRADLSRPFSPPGGTALGAGDVVIELQRVEGANNAVGNKLQVQVNYNGTAKVTFGRDTGQLQGSGGGGL